MLSAHEKIQIAAWKAETDAAMDRLYEGQDAPEWIRGAAFSFLFDQFARLRVAEESGRMIDAQIAHAHTLRSLDEAERARVLERIVEEYFKRAAAA